MKLLLKKLCKRLSVTMRIESLVLLTSLYFAMVINFPFITRMYELAAPGHVIFSLTPFAALSGAFLVIFTLFSFKYIFKPAIIFMILSSASATYAMIKYNVLFDYSMVENIFQTNIAEANSYINLRSFLYVFFFGFIPALFISCVDIKWADSWLKGLLRRIALIVIGFAIVGIIAAFFYKDYASVGRNNHYLNKMILPTHLYYAGRYIKNTYFVKPLEFTVIGEDAKMIKSDNDKPTLMVLVIGETARSQNIAYNGYERNTTPYTEKLGIISFQDVSSCGTATAHSLPCMFSALNRNNYDRKKVNAQSNVLDIIQHAGVDVIWYENDGGHKSVAQRINKEEISPDKANPLCDGSVCVDEVLVEKLKEQLSATESVKDTLVAFHIIGSHGPTYWKRYPTAMETFKPACRRSDIENCTDQEIVNVYDNTLVYTDYVLAKTINLLKEYEDRYNVTLLYLSDHGESLGENGLYLHGTPYAFAPETQTKVPLFMWIPDSYADVKGINKPCLIDAAKQQSFSHDNLFHTLLGLYGVTTEVKDAQLDITAHCIFHSAPKFPLLLAVKS